MNQVFEVGEQYTRRQIQARVGVPPKKLKGDWDTGLASHNGDWFILCNVGSAGRTGHNYGNKFIGETLEWFGKTGSKLAHPRVQKLLNPGRARVFIFFRGADRDPFTFAGLGRAIETFNETPVRIHWNFLKTEGHPEILPQEVEPEEKHVEGATKQITVNIYERNPYARTKCINNYKAICTVCAFDFEKKYGQIGKGFIHVHHLLSLAEIGKKYEVNPIKDLRPVCPNCHAMLHRRKPAYTIAQLKGMLQ